MCGRFTLTIHALDVVADTLQAAIDEQLLASYQPRYNIAPGNQHWLLRSHLARRELIPAGWGLVNHWAMDPAVGYRQINARAETLAERPAFRDAFRERRCVVPADGFYEWHGPRDARRPVWFHSPDHSLLTFAGLYEAWTDPQTGEERTTFTIITTDANEVVAPIHHRMPVLLAPTDIDEWLAGPPAPTLLRPAPAAALASRPVSPRVNTATHDDPECIAAVPDEPAVGEQLKLL